jgi:WD40 repeat protein
LGGAAVVGGTARQQSNGHLFANGSTSSGASSKSNGFLSSLASIADGATGLGLSDRERDKSGLSEKSLHASESRPGHRRSASLPPGQIGKHDLLVTRPSRSKRVNPIAIWQVGCSSVADAAFAPALGAAGEHVLLAIAGRDGYLRVVDVTRERMVVAFRSYFGALLCAAWSPDGRYVAAGGEDDLVSIWCPAEERIIARCEGHTSWVSSVAWDAMLCRDGRYRLGSAGQDAKLLLWDFSLDMLVTPSSQRSSSRSMVRVATGPIVPITGPAVPASTLTLGGYGGGGAGSIGGGGSAAASHPQQTSAHVSVAPSSTVAAPAAAAERRPGKLARLRGHHTGSGSGMRGGDETEGSSTLAPPGLVVDALRRAEVPIVEPVLTHVAHVEPLTAVCFLDTGVVTADCVGNVKVWARPPQELVPPLSLARTGDLD